MAARWGAMPPNGDAPAPSAAFARLLVTVKPVDATVHSVDYERLNNQQTRSRLQAQLLFRISASSIMWNCHGLYNAGSAERPGRTISAS
jgi:hypothetical protein